MKTNPRHAFTIVEVLVVLLILSLFAALAVAAIRNMGKTTAVTAASRQLLDDVGHARQLAMSTKSTVYMVFVATNFWATLDPADIPFANNLLDKQLTGYTFVSYGGLGDQPGHHSWHYLDSWRTLPEGTFIAAQKFAGISQIAGLTIPAFNYTKAIPFPNQDSKNQTLVPYIAFNYLGQLTVDGQSSAKEHEYIPLARGSVSPAINVNTRVPQMGPPSVTETPPGNSSSSAYNLIDIDPLTGRATLQYQKVQ